MAEENQNPEGEEQSPPAEIEKEPAPKKEESLPESEEKHPSEYAGKWRHWHKFKDWYGHNKKLSIPLSILVLVLFLALIPLTRYTVAGMFIKKDYKVQVIDSVSNSPVSGADVTSGSVSAHTDGTGKATLHLKVGSKTLTISKKYYKDGKLVVTVPILDQKNVPKAKIQATGRQVKVSVVNLVSKKSLEGVTIKVAEIDAKTDKSGTALIVLPAGASTQKAELSLDGYNDADVTIKVSDQTVQENNLTMTPLGKIYFLSKASGKIDVVKTNLDGSERKTVLAGTGKEDSTGTILLASRDWKYLALLARRDSDLPKLYLISTDKDELTTMDEGNASFSLVGWSDDNFVYKANRNGYQLWQSKSQALKSYDAAKGQLLTLDQTDASGSSNYDYAQEKYGSIYTIGRNVIYEKSWNYYPWLTVSNKMAGIYIISASGSGAQALKNFSYGPNQSTYIYSIPYEAQQIYYHVVDKNAETYYAYNNGKLVAKADINDDFNKYYQEGATTYLQSPAGNETFWSESTDGKNAFQVGDSDGNNGKRIATLSDDYKVYGWYSDDYLLVSKKSSELYILPKAGVKSEAGLIKIADYHKPSLSFYGYGKGYGGI